jgi:TPR repeat protein
MRRVLSYDTIIRLCLAIVLALPLTLAVVPVAQAGFSDGLTAYQKGEYDEAFAAWKPLADEGDPRAENNLGHMYANGHGVDQDDAMARHWFEMAASHGHRGAQNNLGVMYATGRGGPKNLVRAYMWVSLALRGDRNAIVNLAEIATEMFPYEIDEAERLAAQWRAEHEEGLKVVPTSLKK